MPLLASGFALTMSKFVWFMQGIEQKWESPEMAGKHDYSETRTCLARGIAALDRARITAGMTNLAPGLAPSMIREQIDDLDALIAQAADEVAAAREACTIAARRGLTVYE
jgi:hypothetical protein